MRVAERECSGDVDQSNLAGFQLPGEVAGERFQRSAAWRGQWQQHWPVAIGRLLALHRQPGRRLLHDRTGVGAAEPERIHSGDAGCAVTGKRGEAATDFDAKLVEANVRI